MKMKALLLTALTGVMVCTLAVSPVCAASAEGTDAAAAPSRVSVHDPSVFKSADGEYYIIGSHTASAKSDDLIHWTQIGTDYQNPTNTPIYGNLQENFAESFLWAGYDDGDCTGGYAIWAPDAVWNPYYEWEDGTTGAYMLYYCTSSTYRRSCIGYLVSREADTGYTYADTIVYSGFTTNGLYDGNSTRDTTWSNDYLNLSELIALGSENGGIDEVSENWFSATGEYNNLYAPNAIDPTVFFDASGENLYMVYGSWSGGIFLLPLDAATGEPIYPGTDSIDEASGNFTDRYFGVHLAGGNHQSGEGSYITYDEETGYYYLYETYGGLTAEGGYNMRLFRSENVIGPYLDACGNSASDSGSNNEKYGIKLIGNYGFFGQTGKRSAGHNSALIDEDGSRFLVYHQRFDSTPITEAHEVRVHQQFLNEELWPVTAVYEYRGEQPESYETSEVVGSYEYFNHGTGTDTGMLSEQVVTLNEDGTVTGSVSGTWEKKDSGRGYDYLTLTLSSGTVYKGYFFRQQKETDEENEVMTFAAFGDDNTCIWGSMTDPQDDAMTVSLASLLLDAQMPLTTLDSLSLADELLGAGITWSSSDETVLASDGTVTPQSKDVRVTLTAVISCGEESAEKTYTIKVRSAS